MVVHVVRAIAPNAKTLCGREQTKKMNVIIYSGSRMIYEKIKQLHAANKACKSCFKTLDKIHTESIETTKLSAMGGITGQTPNRTIRVVKTTGGIFPAPADKEKKKIKTKISPVTKEKPSTEEAPRPLHFRIWQGVVKRFKPKKK